MTALRGSLRQCGNVATDPNLTKVRSVIELLAHILDIILVQILPRSDPSESSSRVAFHGCSVDVLGSFG